MSLVKQNMTKKRQVNKNVRQIDFNISNKKNKKGKSFKIEGSIKKSPS